MAFVRRAGALAPCAEGARPQDKPRSADRFWSSWRRGPAREKPRPEVQFNNCGTLHGDGTFKPLKNLVAVKLRSDCMSVLVGVAVKPMSELR